MSSLIAFAARLTLKRFALCIMVSLLVVGGLAKGLLDKDGFPGLITKPYWLGALMLETVTISLGYFLVIVIARRVDITVGWGRTVAAIGVAVFTIGAISLAHFDVMFEMSPVARVVLSSIVSGALGSAVTYPWRARRNENVALPA